MNVYVLGLPAGADVALLVTVAVFLYSSKAALVERKLSDRFNDCIFWIISEFLDICIWA
jgi:hypothetical protein